MSDIQVGEYCRTKNGKIIKFKRIGETYRYIYEKNKSGFYERKRVDYKMIVSTNHFNFDNIVKHSFNIIDLIEVGDYVNGEKVIEIKADSDWVNIGKEILFADDIKSIVTKERFKEVEYKVNE